MRASESTCVGFIKRERELKHAAAALALFSFLNLKSKLISQRRNNFRLLKRSNKSEKMTMMMSKRI